VEKMSGKARVFENKIADANPTPGFKKGRVEEKKVRRDSLRRH
jgi:hypothetical protein